MEALARDGLLENEKRTSAGGIEMWFRAEVSKQDA